MKKNLLLLSCITALISSSLVKAARLTRSPEQTPNTSKSTNQLNNEKINSILTYDFSVLCGNVDGLTGLTSIRNEQISLMSSLMIQVLTTEQIQTFTTTQVQAFTRLQFNAFSTTQIAAFTSTQVAAFTSEQQSSFTPAQRASFGRAQKTEPTHYAPTEEHASATNDTPSSQAANNDGTSTTPSIPSVILPGDGQSAEQKNK